MKRSPYFFLRRQAEKRLQTYSFSSFGLILATMFIGTYAWQNPQDLTPRTALLINDKPPTAEINEAVAAIEEANVAKVAAAAAATDSPSDPLSLRFLNPTGDEIDTEPTLPTEFDKFDPTAELSASTNLGSLLFSMDVTNEYEAVEPRRIFPEGFFTIYATFAYEAMSDGMEWAWVWRHDGEVISGGNELWAYGDDGPGYVYLNPEEGFGPGEYTVEVWVNSELLTSSTLVVNNAAFAAGN
jgi:hypothetical protein